MIEGGIANELILGGIFVAAGAICIICIEIFESHNRRKGDAVRLSAGTVGKDLGPRLDRYMGPGALVYLLAGDGQSMEDKTWKGMVEKWLEDGSTIYYFVTDPNKSVDHNVDALIKKYKKSFLYCSFDNLEVANEDRQTIENLKTNHPTLFQTSHGKGMWLEGYHPAKSPLAYDCEFVPPSEPQTDKRFAENKLMLDHLLKSYFPTVQLPS